MNPEFIAIIKSTWHIYKKYQHTNFAGYCAQASIELINELLKNNVSHQDMKLYIEYNEDVSHIFIQWKNFYIDATCEQFGQKGIYIKNTPYKWTQKKTKVLKIKLDLDFKDNIWLHFNSWTRKFQPKRKTINHIQSVIEKGKK